ncbi:NADH:ubiquinone reductase (Na(+)-transporting) subunit F [Spirochaeta isovalerica]|uniref:Na+-transporting NADH:ubiquinone oxidoreductase subunit F n=1 Tax=Spirochaeta isovalerica TaxID=150 RepID=A0A841RB95_9SPIO|nr:2Fe-2S iron-sulfur cluster binding domain-containing protein [Spirochaeta isovalerica]MBB6481203.1 Na+-transporting NADH:ubiquinone oxidoreductase subunit F [Spirochaeta isovalerica]
MMIIIAPGAVALIAAILAAAISIVDKVVNNYGEVELDINDGKKKIKLDGGESLLSSLAGQEIFVPSACGGRGTCGACKCQVTSDVGPYLPTETPFMTKENLADNIRLACQVKIKSDISIKIPDELFNIKKYDSIVKSIVDVTHDIKEVTFDLQGEEINFEAGKYVQLVVPPHGKIKGSTQRAYSMASKPGEKDIVRLLIRLVPGGIATTWVHTELKEGDRVELVGPFGDFFRTPTDTTMVCVAGGSGMAPFMSILFDMLDTGELDREVWYFFGARTVKDMFYLDELRELEKKMPNFHFVPALSEPEEGTPWDGATGLITDVLDKYLKEEIGTDKKREGYLCGSPGMINACNNVFTANKVSLDDIFYDKF